MKDFTVADILAAAPKKDSKRNNRPAYFLASEIVHKQYPGMFYSIDADFAVHRGWKSLERAIDNGEVDKNERMLMTDLQAMQRAGRSRPQIPGWNRVT